MADATLAGRWVVAIVLITAGGAKLLRGDRDQLTAAIRNYGVLPDRLSSPLAVVLPWLEVALGALLALGVLLVVVAGGAAVLLGAFVVAVGWNLSRGRRFACGCGGDGTISWSLLARDVSLCGVAVAVAVGPSTGLAAWPGWAAEHASGPWQSLVPIPLAVIVVMAAMRLLAAAVPLWSSHALIHEPERPMV